MASSRIFYPNRKGFPATAKPSDIVWYDDDNEVSRISSLSSRGRMPVVIWIDGACRRYGMPEARASYGVYTGQDSRYNTSGYIPDGSQTSQAAEIYPAIHVVKDTLDQMGSKVCKDGVVIVSDSTYLVRAITGCVYTWVENGFVNGNGGQLVNGEAFKALYGLIIAWKAVGQGSASGKYLESRINTLIVLQKQSWIVSFECADVGLISLTPSEESTSSM